MGVRLQRTDKGLILTLRVQPKASRDGVVGVLGDRLKVAVTAAPEKGKANVAVVKTLAKALGVRASQVSIISGETSRDKQVLLAGCDAAAIERTLAALLG